MPIVLKSGSLNLLETSGLVQACNGITLLLPLHQRCAGQPVLRGADGMRCICRVIKTKIHAIITFNIRCFMLDCFLVIEIVGGQKYVVE